ncbi:hypothetical protein [Fundidesulfovibrio agrisoli]|uniref:hypothetical protein n=1 Tax=Fundidesulfovibrio agrisoli TaxID=2922717 RepID=UPI001FACAC98|nr:hypothetical protein [Fundidesulfovibrio agrisoli]
MKKIFWIALVVLSLSLCSCARPASRMIAISPGMSREEVIAAVGKPNNIDYADGVERLYYAVYDWPLDSNVSRYVIVLVDGKVYSYGSEAISEEW